MFKKSKIVIPKDVLLLGDSGYQGMKDIHFKSKIPITDS